MHIRSLLDPLLGPGLVLGLALASGVPVPAPDQPALEAPRATGASRGGRGQDAEARRLRVHGTEDLLDGRGDASLRAYAEAHLAPSYRASFASEEALLAHLRALREAVGPVGNVGVTVEDGVTRLHVTNRERASVVAFRLEAEPPHRIVALELAESGPVASTPEVTWDTLERTLAAAVEEHGFSGSVLAVRDGRVVLDRGFGWADPEREHPVTPETMFAIGSTPIDFTHGAVLKLAELGAVDLDDSIAEYLDDVPDDKRAITLEHLRTGRSGLYDFPGIPGVDENLDLSWIDRDELLRRVLSSKLLFEPGTAERHSHAAWGLLAAVVEVASGQGYEAFLREHFFAPAGMERTGHYPHTLGFPAEETAVGLGGNVWGEVNSPRHWGETSWLVLGSGGMVSTPRDLRRWRTYLRSGGLGEAMLRRYGVDGVFLAEGGNDRGFVNTIGSAGDDLVIVCSNSHAEMGDLSARLAMAAARLATGE